MTNAQDYSVIVGALLPPVMAVIIQSHWPSWFKSWVALAACVVAGLLTTYFAGTLVFSGGDAQTIGTDVALVMGAAWALYHGFYKPSGITPAVERATNLPRIAIVKEPPDAPSGQAPAS